MFLVAQTCGRSETSQIAPSQNEFKHLLSNKRICDDLTGTNKSF